MTTVTVPVWQLSGGEKVSSTLTLSVHAALAEDVKEIFTGIYNDPERFPIHDVGGYTWRGDSATGEHNCGTAIDINANENYQIRDGQVLAGSCWEPGSNAYSISPTPPWCASLPSTAGAGAATPGLTAATIPRATTTICTSPTWESDQATHPGPRLRGGFPLSPLD
ncbi:hypothetical protein M5E87_08385 [Flavonifractor plautii]|nr:hypothetical protein M5E87_08385 [Flavonifractor plautii]